MNSEGYMDFETSTKYNVLGNDRNSSTHVNLLEKMIFEQIFEQDHERRSKNVLIFDIRKSSKMSYDEQTKDYEQ